MSVRRLVIELRLGHESQRRNSNSIIKFLSYSEYRSPLSGFSRHWLIIIRSLIRSAGDDTILFFRLRRRIRFDFLNSWMRITMHVRQKSMHVRQKCARIPYWWRELHRQDMDIFRELHVEKRYVEDLFVQLHRRTTCYTTCDLEWIFGIVYIYGVPKIWNVSRRPFLRQTSCRLQSFVPLHDDMLDLKFRSYRSWVTNITKWTWMQLFTTHRLYALQDYQSPEVCVELTYLSNSISWIEAILEIWFLMTRTSRTTNVIEYV